MNHRHCAWCGREKEIRPENLNWCPQCLHQADAPREQCGCLMCVSDRWEHPVPASSSPAGANLNKFLDEAEELELVQEVTHIELPPQWVEGRDELPLHLQPLTPPNESVSEPEDRWKLTPPPEVSRDHIPDITAQQIPVRSFSGVADRNGMRLWVNNATDSECWVRLMWSQPQLVKLVLWVLPYLSDNDKQAVREKLNG